MNNSITYTSADGTEYLTFEWRKGMPGKKTKPAVSEKQRRFFGAVASGSVNAPGLSKAEARRKLHATKGKRLK